MKLFFNKYFVIFLFLSPFVYAQGIEVITHGLTKYEPVGTLEIVIDFEVINVSADTQIVFEVRTLDSLPDNWTSSLCFGENCFAPFVDSVATTQTFSTPAPGPGDTVITSIHFVTDLTSIATGYVQIEVGTFRHPEDRVVLNFTGTTDPTVSVNENNLLNTYSLFQNYPNPFNPSTRISYNVGEPGLVQLKVYNVLGVEVATLVNDYKNSGNHFVDYNAAKLSSGIYFYSLSVNSFTQTRKMILEK